MFEALRVWFFSLGDRYGVDPLVFGAIYVGAIPFFTLAVGWLVRNLRRGRPVTLPVLAAGVCFVSAYLYLLVAGRDIPVWVYAFVGALVAFGAVSTARKVRRQVAAPDPAPPPSDPGSS